MISWLLGFLAANPIGALIITIMSVFRMVFKPLCALIQVFVDATGNPKYAATWLAIENNKFFKSISWLSDYLVSIKLPTPTQTALAAVPVTTPTTATAASPAGDAPKAN